MIRTIITLIVLSLLVLPAHATEPWHVLVGVDAESLAAAGLTATDVEVLNAQAELGTFAEAKAALISANISLGDSMAAHAALLSEFVNGSATEQQLAEGAQAAELSRLAATEAQRGLRDEVLRLMSAQAAATLENIWNSETTGLPAHFRVVTRTEEEVSKLAHALRARERASRLGVQPPLEVTNLLQAAESNFSVAQARLRIQAHRDSIAAELE